ncbi:MAG TPA: diphthine--ammonia ligase, partial [Euryarchaeota archaeon]|nr:diphthine--ammonia ligase [Euryarchaeota archaeon]
MSRAAVLFSGGKDSVYATYIAQQQCMDIETALTIIPSDTDSHMFHVPNIRFASVISSAMGLPSVTIEVGGHREEIDVLGDAIDLLRVDTVVTGAIASDYQATRIDRLCHDDRVRVYSPLWHKDQEMLLREMICAGFRIVVVGVFAEGLGQVWLGRELDLDALEALIRISEKRKIHIGGEGGEIETIVLD